MKKFYLSIAILFLAAITAEGQSRKYTSQFSHLQSYYNPGLTGYEGSTLRGLVRNQWAGWEGAPKTYFFSAELDFAELGGNANAALLGKNAVAVNLFSDQYGPFLENELIVSYASRIRLNQSTNLRLGAGVNYNHIRLDGNRLTAEQGNDPMMMQYANGFARMEVLDFNLGLALTHEKYYVSYAVHNVNGGALSSGDIFMDRKPPVNIFQAGYRSKVGDQIMLASNLMYRFQEDLPDNVEFNVKLLLMDKLWIGGGHRVNYANSYQLGVLFEGFRLGYVYETPMVKSYLLPNATHELMLVYHLFGSPEKKENGLSIW
ncbi:PorP/SprF family type IX secretion system membrane protein [Cyclobacterium plantarum]|uniref:Type IX secretion system membrane protein PorP/SprF n=1 Tax=Cyclobacterium plantarum TaxID=2716263 RepID=A0ABX0HDK1_9BACT|nr:type IX secretion system membrane protein PorP/SprF [Cyclobacterium plantarum]NHE59395.1 type IX secretion system membrane protein PorP/SprF [Cyclobacterium plantarum]